MYLVATNEGISCSSFLIFPRVFDNFLFFVFESNPPLPSPPPLPYESSGAQPRTFRLSCVSRVSRNEFIAKDATHRSHTSEVSCTVPAADDASCRARKHPRDKAEKKLARTRASERTSERANMGKKYRDSDREDRHERARPGNVPLNGYLHGRNSAESKQRVECGSAEKPAWLWWASSRERRWHGTPFETGAKSKACARRGIARPSIFTI